MIRPAARLVIPALALALSGCLTHMAAREDSGSLSIRWHEDYAAGCRAAAGTGRRPPQAPEGRHAPGSCPFPPRWTSP